MNSVMFTGAANRHKWCASESSESSEFTLRIYIQLIASWGN